MNRSRILQNRRLLLAVLVFASLTLLIYYWASPSTTSAPRQLLSTARRIEDVLMCKTFSVHEYEQGREMEGLFNFNDGNLVSSRHLIMLHSIPNCPACVRWASAMREYLQLHSRLYDPVITSFIMVRGADSFFEEQGFSSFPVPELWTRENGTWVKLSLDWGRGEHSPRRFFENVEHRILGVPLRQEPILQQDILQYQLILTPEDDGYLINWALAHGLPMRYFEYRDFVFTFDLKDYSQLERVLSFSNRLSTELGSPERLAESTLVDIARFFDPSEFSMKGRDGQLSFRNRQGKFLKFLEQETWTSLGKAPKLQSLFENATRAAEETFLGHAPRYVFPEELGPKSKAILQEHFGPAWTARMEYRQTVMPENRLPSNIIGEDARRLKDIAAQIRDFYKEADDLGAVVLPSNTPGTILEAFLSDNPRTVLFQFSGNYLYDMRSALGTMRRLSDSEYAFVFIEKGKRFFGFPLKSVESVLLETPVIVSPMVIYYDNGQLEYIDEELLMDRVIRERRERLITPDE